MCPVEGWLIQPVWSQQVKPALGRVLAPSFLQRHSPGFLEDN